MDEAVDSAAGAIESPTETGSGKKPASPVIRVAVWVLAALVLAAAVFGGVVGLRSLDRASAARDAVARASVLLGDAEEDLLVVDEAVRVEISSTVATQAVEASELALVVADDAISAKKILDDAMPDLPPELVPLAKALKESAEARAEMMEIAPTILEADRQAALAIPYADQALSEIKAAEDLSAQAVVEFNKHTAAAVKTSDDLSVQAEARLGAAQSLLTSATASFPGADYAAFSAYVTAKVELIALAKEIDALWLAGNLAGSNTKLAAYNQRDAEIVAMAQALPASVRDPIANAYTAATADASARYFEVRERARVAGERASELQGSVGKSN
jgi:hypothetical protein